MMTNMLKNLFVARHDLVLQTIEHIKPNQEYEEACITMSKIGYVSSTDDLKLKQMYLTIIDKV